MRLRVPWWGLFKFLFLLAVAAGLILGGAWAITHYANERHAVEVAEEQSVDDRPANASGERLAIGGADETVPEGLPGPFAVESWVGDVIEYGRAAATPDAALLMYRAAIEGPGCTHSSKGCTQWLGALRPRQPEAPARSIVVFESDTPSGAQLEAIAGGRKRFVILGREGIYQDDDRHFLMKMLDEHGRRVTEAMVLLEGSPSWGGALAHTGADRFLACWSAPAQGAERLLNDLRIRCRVIESNGRLKPEFEVTVGLPVGRYHQPALAWRGNQGLLVWVRGETLEAVTLNSASLEKETGGREVQAVSAPGEAIPLRPWVVAGHGGYLVVWQTPAGRLRVRRLDGRGSPMAPALEVPEGFTHHLYPDGVAVVPEGFMLSVRAGQTSKVLLIAPSGQSAQKLARKEGASRLFFDDISAIHVHTGPPLRMDWRLAASLIRRQ